MKKRAKILCLSLLIMAALSVFPVFASSDTAGTKRVALTYDDGPNGKVTEALLEVLAEEDVPATFFLCAYRVREYPDLTQRISREGHTLGVHGSTHVQMDILSEEEMRFELRDSIDAISEITGRRVRHFRPPYGFTNETLQAIAEEMGLQTVLWNVDPEDWKYKDAQKITARVLAQTGGESSIILLHDLDLQTVYATRRIIHALRQQGYEFVTLNEL